MKKMLPLSILPAALPAGAHPGHIGLHADDLGYLLIGAAVVAGTWGVRTGLRVLARRGNLVARRR
jgi:hypothetical protein